MSHRRPRPKVVFSLLAVMLLATIIASLTMGSNHLSWRHLGDALLGQSGWLDNLVVLDLRLPRILVAMLIGMGIATSGVVLQGMTRNDLAGPDTVGTNAGSGLGITFLLVAYPSAVNSQPWLLPLGAVFGAIAMTVLVFALASQHGSVLPSRLLLVGIAVGFGAHAAMLMLSLRMGFTTYNEILAWMSGTLKSASWLSVAILFPCCLLFMTLAFSRARVLNTLALGESVAMGLGVSVEWQRLLLLGTATMLTSACVAIGGHIGFLGLAAPHLARRMIGSHHGVLFPAAALCGAILLLLADSLGRHLFSPIEMPAGVLVGVLGGAYFLYLLATTRG